jgi:hypothetical protein
VDIRLPSLAFNTKRRFAYVELASPVFSNPLLLVLLLIPIQIEATAALAANGRKLEDEHFLVVKLSDPETKKSRDMPAYTYFRSPGSSCLVRKEGSSLL